MPGCWEGLHLPLMNGSPMCPLPYRPFRSRIFSLRLVLLLTDDVPAPAEGARPVVRAEPASSLGHQPLGPPPDLTPAVKTAESSRSRTARGSSASGTGIPCGVFGTSPSSDAFWRRSSRRLDPSRRPSCTTHTACRSELTFTLPDCPRRQHITARYNFRDG